MNKSIRKTIFLSALCLGPIQANAQLASSPDKFLGNITTYGQVNAGGGVEEFYKLWNQITPENETKWSSIEGNRRGSFNFSDADRSAKYAKEHDFPFKFHTLIWGSQYPGWMNNLSTEEQTKAIEEWFDAVKEHYPDLAIMDVVNEAIAGHQPAPYKAALGGDGKTGYDWIIKAFEMAYERWPDAILIYNDYNTFKWQKTEFIDLVKTLRDAGAPIDAYGCQSHDLTDMEFNEFKAAMDEIQDSLKMPMYSTEYDIGTSDDALQKKRYEKQIPYMWEADYCAGITLWGYVYGKTWTTDGNSGIIKNGKDRPAMTWLREYMQSDAAKNVKSPFPGMVKEASVYVKPASLIASKDEPMPIEVRARLKTKMIEKIDFYVDGELYQTLTEAPYKLEYTPTETRKYNLKAVVTDTDGTTYERLSSFTAYKPRETYSGEPVSLPGTLEAENYDIGADGVAFHDSDKKREGDASSYRSDEGGVDIVKGNNGYAIGYTNSGEWLEYTVDVKEAGLYEYDAWVSSGADNSSFSVSLSNDSGTQALTPSLHVPCVKSNDWSTYKAVHGRLLVPLEAGIQILRINITGSSCNIDKIIFNHVDVDENIKVEIAGGLSSATVNEDTPIKVDATSPNGEIKEVKVYIDNVLVKDLTEPPFETTVKITSKGTYTLTLEAYDAEGKVSAFAKYTLKVNNKRAAYKSVISIPGVFEAENFDKGGEGLTFHDSNSNNEGDTNYRSDSEGVDFVKGNGGTCIGYTAIDEWLEYTIDVKEAGEYTYVATVSSGVNNSGFNIGIVKDDKVTTLAKIKVPQTGNNDWSKYKKVEGELSQELEAGQQILRITITGNNCNIDKIELKRTGTDGIIDISADGPASQLGAYDLYGRKVNGNYKGIVIINGKKHINK